MEDQNEVATKGYVSAEVEKLAVMVAAGFEETATETELKTSLANLENRLVFRMDTMELRLESKIDSKIESLEQKMTSLEQRMATKEDLKLLEQRMATKDDLASLEQRMATKLDLEAAVGKLAGIVKDALDEMASRREVRDLAVRVRKVEAQIGMGE